MRQQMEHNKVRTGQKLETLDMKAGNINGQDFRTLTLNNPALDNIKSLSKRNRKSTIKKTWNLHFYADDTQIYKPLKQNYPITVKPLLFLSEGPQSLVGTKPFKFEWK